MDFYIRVIWPYIKTNFETSFAIKQWQFDDTLSINKQQRIQLLHDRYFVPGHVVTQGNDVICVDKAEFWIILIMLADVVYVFYSILLHQPLYHYLINIYDKQYVVRYIQFAIKSIDFFSIIFC